MRVFLPISLDQWRSPLAALLRAVVEANGGLEFVSFSNPLSAEDRSNGARLWRLPQLRRTTPGQAWQERPEVVHTVSLNPRNLAICAYCKARGARYLTTINLEVEPGSGRDWWCYRAAAGLADGMCAVSEAAANRPRADVGRRFLGVIPNGFDPEFFDPAAPGVAAGAPAELGTGFVLFVSALEPRKHPEFIIDLARRCPDLRFVAAGWEVPKLSRPFLPLFAAPPPNLRWLGHVDQMVVRALLARAAVLAFPSEREGLPLTVIEALGMGLPVIAQPKSSLPELIRDGDNGRLIGLDRADEWCAALRGYVAAGDAARAPAAARLRRETVERFAWPQIGARYGAVYTKLLGGAG